MDPTLPNLLAGGALAWAANLVRQGMGHWDVVRRAQERFPGASYQTAAALYDRAAGTVNLTRPVDETDAGFRFRAGDVPRGQPGQTGWRYTGYVDFTNPDTGHTARVPFSIVSPQSLTMGEVTGRMLQDAAAFANAGVFRPGSPPKKAEWITGTVDLFAVERWTP